MAFQLVFTSAPRGLTLGRSGFCTVARHREISDSLAQALERCSAYERTEDGCPMLPVIHAFRLLRVGTSTYHVLSRIQDAGVDYTQRGNHLAQHLVFLPGELNDSTTPADVFLHWNGWLENWSGPPRYLTEAEQPLLASIPPAVSLPARYWQELTGDAAHASLLVQSPLKQGAIVTSAALPPATALHLIGESLLLLESEEGSVPASWTIPFTTHLQAHDHEEDFNWRFEECPSAESISSRRNLPVHSLDTPSWPPVKNSTLARRAREGGAAAPKLKDTARLPVFPVSSDESEPAPKKLRPTPSTSPVPSPVAPGSSRLYIFAAVFLLLLVLAGAWFLTSETRPATPSLVEQLAQLRNPSQREPLRRFLQEHPRPSGDEQTDAALEQSALWLEASDLLEKLQFLRRQNDENSLRDALARSQNLPHLAELKNSLPALGYEISEAQTWLDQKTAAALPPALPAPPPSQPASPPPTLAGFFGPHPACLAMISSENSLSLTPFPELAAWMGQAEQKPGALIRIFPLNELPLSGEGTIIKSQPRRNRSQPLRFYQGVHLLFDMKESEETEESRAFEIVFARNFESLVPAGTFGRVLQFEDVSGPLFSVFILKQELTQPLLRLPMSMTDFDPGLPGYRLRKEFLQEAKISLSPGASGRLQLPSASAPAAAGIPLNAAVSWEKLPSPATPGLPELLLNLDFPAGDDTQSPFPLILFEGAASP